MRAFRTSKWTVGLLAFFLLCGRTLAQAPSALEETGLGRQETSNALPTSAPESTGKQQESTAEQTKLPSPSTITLPAGTRILMALKSPLHTTSAVAGSGLYLETVSPVVQENHVAIPVMTQVLGTVDGDKRPGRVQGRAQFHFRFTNLVFANNYVLPIDGALQSLPGNKKVRTQDAEGTIQPVDQIDAGKRRRAPHAQDRNLGRMAALQARQGEHQTDNADEETGRSYQPVLTLRAADHLEGSHADQRPHAVPTAAHRRPAGADRRTGRDGGLHAAARPADPRLRAGADRRVVHLQ